VVRPDKSVIEFANDEIRNSQAQGFDLKDFCDKTRMLRIFPTVPNINKDIEK
jgi:hypothetical protein